MRNRRKVFARDPSRIDSCGIPAASPETRMRRPSSGCPAARCAYRPPASSHSRRPRDAPKRRYFVVSRIATTSRMPHRRRRTDVRRLDGSRRRRPHYLPRWYTSEITKRHASSPRYDAMILYRETGRANFVPLDKKIADLGSLGSFMLLLLSRDEIYLRGVSRKVCEDHRFEERSWNLSATSAINIIYDGLSGNFLTPFAFPWSRLQASNVSSGRCSGY